MDSKPNIVWFITDDTGFDMLSYSGGAIPTPNIDRIAREGVTCRNFHTVSAACCPSRYSYLTGTYPGRCPSPRFASLHPADQMYVLGFDVDVLPPVANIGSALQSAGYLTGYVGKYHTGTPRHSFFSHDYQLDDDPTDPVIAEHLQHDYQQMQQQVRNNGFDYAEALAWGNLDDRPIEAMRHHNMEWHTDAALKFVDEAQRRGGPFFLQMAATVFHGPHHIESLNSDGRATEAGMLDEMPNVQPSRQSIFDRLNEAGVEVNHRTAGGVWADDAFGAVMNRLDELGLADNTIVIFSTDHGPGTTDSKFTCYQGGVRIPFCMKWPGRIEAGSTCDAKLQSVDMLPTLASMAGVALPADARFDGIDRSAQLYGADDDREDLYFEWGRLRAVRTDRWKYVMLRYRDQEIEAMKRSAAGGDDLGAYLPYYPGRAGDFMMHMFPGYWDADQLYDLQADPGEQHNLVNDPAYAAVVEQMRQRLGRYLASFKHPYPMQADPFQHSQTYHDLTRRNMADEAIYQQYFYLENAY